MEETREYWQEEFRKVCKQISEIPFQLKKSKEEKAWETRLWNKKRSIIAKLNDHNNRDNY